MHSSTKSNLLAVEGVLGLGLSDAVNLEADLAEGLDVNHPTPIEHEGRLGHAVVDALVVQGLELVPEYFSRMAACIKIDVSRLMLIFFTFQHAPSSLCVGRAG